MKSMLEPLHQLEYLGLVLVTALTRVFLPQEKLQTLQSTVWELSSLEQTSICYCMNVLRLKVASFEAVLYTPFQSRLTLCLLTPKPGFSWNGGYPPNTVIWEAFLSVMWKVLTMDASLTGWEGVLDSLSFQVTWSTEEARLPLSTGPTCSVDCQSGTNPTSPWQYCT